MGGNGNGDGPKWVCDIHRVKTLAKKRKAKDPAAPGCVVYSIGSRGDFSFELSVQEAVGVDTCEIHIFDPGNYGPEMPKKLHAVYHRWGLAKDTHEEKDNVFLSLSDTVKKLGHENLGMIDIFKIDCDGCEWETYEHWLDRGAVPFLQQILVEAHKAPMGKVLQFFDRLMEEGYVQFHKESNIQHDPECLEFAFLKLDKEFYLEANEIAKSFPSKSLAPIPQPEAREGANHANDNRDRQFWWWIFFVFAFGFAMRKKIMVILMRLIRTGQDKEK